MNIYCFSTLSFAKLQFKSVINKAFHKHGVASFTDAWIETETWSRTANLDASHLLQMRGLKPPIVPNINIGNVASFTDAWIETDMTTQKRTYKKSHLLQMRGLKPVKYLTLLFVKMSHLLQMRGLKLNNRRFDLECEESHLLQMRGLKQSI